MTTRASAFARILLRHLACVSALAGCGDDQNGSSDGETPPKEDPRSMAEICVTYCDNARAHGCEGDVTVGAPTCVEGCDIPAPSPDERCTVTWKNHTACLADVPNLCDANDRDLYCLDAYCDMRAACELPDPQCR